MEDVYITLSNMKKLDSDLKPDPVQVQRLIESYSKNLRLILSGPELNFLSKNKFLLEVDNESSELIASNIPKIVIKNSIMPKDARWVYLGGAPAYHASKDCPRLNQDYINFEIPAALNGELIEEYRDFFIQNIPLLKEDEERFYVRISTKFGLTSFDVRTIKYGNSGRAGISNLKTNPDEILQKIKDTINSMLDFKSKPENKKLITQCGFATHKAKCGVVRYIDMPGDNPVKYWHEKKKMLKSMLVEHIVATVNPDLKFSKSKLDSAGFTCCKECSKSIHSES